MSDLRFGCYALAACVAIAILAGCGGGNGASPPGPSCFNGACAQRDTAAPRMTTARRTRPTTTSYGVLYQFKGGPEDGGSPNGSLLNIDGTLYGTTFNGGSSTCATKYRYYPEWCGTVFAITKSGKESVLYSFKGGSDGESPLAGLIDVNGTLHGTTREGGGNGAGTVFSITTSGAETVLHRFTGVPNDGSTPVAELLNVNGTLYGTTFNGGSSTCFTTTHSPEGCGTVFAITPSGAETVLYSFNGYPDDGSGPGNLVNLHGTLYGTTALGGSHCKELHGCGTVFAITTSGAERVLYSFKGNRKDGQGSGNIVNVSGTFYGTTNKGGADNAGTAFKITTLGNETLLYSFLKDSSGGGPGGLINVDGTLYGTTGVGGRNGWGTLLSITTSGTLTVLHSFGASGDGKQPVGDLTNVNGTLYGTTRKGATGGNGTAFWLKP